jgi:hypothetical protein
VATVGSGAADVLTGAIDTSKFETLLQQQMELQRVMQVYSMRSNISRTEHEIDMTAIRNMRLG